MHIAAALGTPTVAIFGPSKSVETAPFSPVGRVVEKDYPCRAQCDESSCHNVARLHGCMLDVTVAEVLAAADAALQGAREACSPDGSGECS
jgi:ADP-heptose:LPS heptosyltransferase